MCKSWSTVPWLLLSVVSVAASSRAAMPEPVSPAGRVGSRCPSFSWSVDGSARGYEVVVYRVSAEGEVGREPVVSAKLPAGAASWTPPLEQCFAGGARYAWTVRAAGGRAEGWSEPSWFEVAAGPGPEEVEAALEVLQRYLADSGRGEGSGGGDRIAELLGGGGPAAATPAGSSGGDGARSIAPRPRGRAVDDRVDVEDSAQVVRTVQAAVPALGNPSLRLSANVALSAASNVFKDGSVFLWDDTTGNTALGRLALASATGTARSNTAVGREALRYTVPGVVISDYGSNNTAVGDFALRNNTTGNRNTASGSAALRSNTTGIGNTASGGSALRNNTTGFGNTASGSSSLHDNSEGYRNTASGAYALYSNTTGYRNTASGAYALFSNTYGHHNTANGSYALRNNTTGVFNTASGSYALRENTIGSRNTASGYGALRYNTTGHLNTASGSEALRNNTTGYRNTASGYRALRSNTTGRRNTAVGIYAGFFATEGSDNIFLGSGAGGFEYDGNTIRIGGTSTGGDAPGAGQQNRTFINGIRGIATEANDAIAVLIDSNGQLGTASSSAAVKQDIAEIGEGSQRLLELRPVSFRYRQHAASDPATPVQYGLIAEEVAEVFPELVVYDEEGRPETVKYHLLAPLLLHELQRAERELSELRERVVAVERRGHEPTRRPRATRRGR